MDFFHNELFSGKRILITGGGSGIGLRIAKDMLKAGATVAILGRDSEKLKLAQAQLGFAGSDRVHAIECNLRDEAVVEEAMKNLKSSWGKLDVLVNNAGGQFPGGTESISPKGFRAVIDTNLTGTFLITRACFTEFFKGQGGSIVSILMNMRSGMPLMPHSAAARAGVDNLTKSWAIEWAHHGVRVNAVAPGIIKSSGLSTYAPEFQAALQKMTANNYASRFGTESEVSNAVLFLASQAASYITGQTLFVDGGESIYSPFLPPRSHGTMPAPEESV
ncbi:MAG: SDR family oxidoreductase [Spirochaetia bacterium]|nr:SDR family oxidoreductase [Spirochaetia bacterium]